jgi:hypothetical protein
MPAEIKKDDWGRDIWVPADYPFIIRVHRQSSQAGNHGWAINNVGEPLETYEEARALADRPLGRGEMERTVCQAINPHDWQRSGKWRTCFSRKRGNKISEPGPLETANGK